MQGTTKTGFHFEVDENRTNSFTVVRAIVEMNKETDELKQMELVLDVVDAFIGAEQIEAIKEHVTKEKGYDDIESVMSEVFDIFTQAKESKLVKNSSSSEA